MSSRKRFIVLTPFAQAEVVAGIAKLHGIEADVVHTDSGAALVREIPVPVFDDWDISELLGDAGKLEDVSRSAHNADSRMEETSDPCGTSDNTNDADQRYEDVDPDNPLEVAAVFSRLSPYGVVLIQADLGDDVGGEDGVSGLINAQRVISGEPGEEIAAGLLLYSLDPKIEALALGLEDYAQIDPNVIRSDAAEKYVDQLLQSEGNVDDGSSSASAPGAEA